MVTCRSSLFKLALASPAGVLARSFFSLPANYFTVEVRSRAFVGQRVCGEKQVEV